jgi:hypothetical protein
LNYSFQVRFFALKTHGNAFAIGSRLKPHHAPIPKMTLRSTCAPIQASFRVMQCVFLPALEKSPWIADNQASPGAWQDLWRIKQQDRRHFDQRLVSHNRTGRSFMYFGPKMMACCWPHANKQTVQIRFFYKGSES